MTSHLFSTSARISSQVWKKKYFRSLLSLWLSRHRVGPRATTVRVAWTCVAPLLCSSRNLRPKVLHFRDYFPPSLLQWTSVSRNEMMEKRLNWNFILLILAQFSGALGQVTTELRDVKFGQDYNKNEMPPSHDGKPLKVSNFYPYFVTVFQCIFCNYWPQILATCLELT